LSGRSEQRSRQEVERYLRRVKRHRSLAEAVAKRSEGRSGKREDRHGLQTLEKYSSVTDIQYSRSTAAPIKLSPEIEEGKEGRTKSDASMRKTTCISDAQRSVEIISRADARKCHLQHISIEEDLFMLAQRPNRSSNNNILL
jgi:hypothetical protein